MCCSVRFASRGFGPICPGWLFFGSAWEVDGLSGFAKSLLVWHLVGECSLFYIARARTPLVRTRPHPALWYLRCRGAEIDFRFFSSASWARHLAIERVRHDPLPLTSKLTQ